RNLAERAADRRKRERNVASGALGRAGRPTRQDYESRGARRLRWLARWRRRDQRIERVVTVLARVQPRTVASMLQLQIGNQGLELLVVDEQIDSLTQGDFTHLRAREARVHEDHAGAASGRSEQRLEEASVVARHDRDAVTRLEPLFDPGRRDRIDAVVEL